MLSDEDRFRLGFGIQRSIRYHERRHAHYNFLHRLTNTFTILISGTVILEMTGSELPPWIKYGAGLAALLGVFDLVTGFSERAGVHRDLRRRFCLLEQELGRSGSQDTPAEVLIKRLEIEADEPPIFRAVDVLCHNELCAANGYSRADTDERGQTIFRSVPLLVRVSANWYRWPNLSNPS